MRCKKNRDIVMMGKKNNCLKLMKGVNPEMLLVHCVIQREILVSKNISRFLIR